MLNIEQTNVSSTDIITTLASTPNDSTASSDANLTISNIAPIFHETHTVVSTGRNKVEIKERFPEGGEGSNRCLGGSLYDCLTQLNKRRYDGEKLEQKLEGRQ